VPILRPQSYSHRSRAAAVVNAPAVSADVPEIGSGYISGAGTEMPAPVLLAMVSNDRHCPAGLVDNAAIELELPEIVLAADVKRSVLVVKMAPVPNRTRVPEMVAVDHGNPDAYR